MPPLAHAAILCNVCLECVGIGIRAWGLRTFATWESVDSAKPVSLLSQVITFKTIRVALLPTASRNHTLI